jgi:ABC-2 type transport system ATP-binding protein
MTIPHTWAVEARGLTKRFGEQTAVDGVDLQVAPGTVYAVLGPNGAGKTTTIQMLTTLLHPDAGTVTVYGRDAVREAHAVRHLIAVTGQYASVDESLTATENLVLVARLQRPRSSPGPRCFSSTNPPPASTRAPATGCGT